MQTHRGADRRADACTFRSPALTREPPREGCRFTGGGGGGRNESASWRIEEGSTPPHLSSQKQNKKKGILRVQRGVAAGKDIGTSELAALKRSRRNRRATGDHVGSPTGASGRARGLTVTRAPGASTIASLGPETRLAPSGVTRPGETNSGGEKNDLIEGSISKR